MATAKEASEEGARSFAIYKETVDMAARDHGFAILVRRVLAVVQCERNGAESFEKAVERRIAEIEAE